MISFFSYLVTTFAIIFLVLRIAIAFCYTLELEIGIVPIDFNIEIILLFLTIVCLILIIKRNILGAVIYFGSHIYYYGNDLLKNITALVNKEEITINYISLFLSFIGVIIPTLVLLDIVFNSKKERSGGLKNVKTDWFFNNKEYDREHDSRADENQYKF